jgi:DNA-binding beta-propeller fold protein YncE
MGPSNRFRVACGVVATVPTGDAPHEVAVAPDGRRAVGTNYGTRETPGSNLTVIDVPAAKTAGKEPDGLAYSKLPVQH